MKIESIKIISEFENYEEFLTAIKLGKSVIKKHKSCMGMFFDEAPIKYDKENDCFYFIHPNGSCVGEKSVYPFKTAEDFEKETGSNVLGLGHKETYKDRYPLEDFYMVELTKY